MQIKLTIDETDIVARRTQANIERTFKKYGFQGLMPNITSGIVNEIIMQINEILHYEEDFTDTRGDSVIKSRDGF